MWTGVIPSGRLQFEISQVERSMTHPVGLAALHSWLTEYPNQPSLADPQGANASC